jgi:hypothetical protein
MLSSNSIDAYAHVRFLNFSFKTNSITVKKDEAVEWNTEVLVSAYSLC